MGTRLREPLASQKNIRNNHRHLSFEIKKTDTNCNGLTLHYSNRWMGRTGRIGTGARTRLFFWIGWVFKMEVFLVGWFAKSSKRIGWRKKGNHEAIHYVAMSEKEKDEVRGGGKVIIVHGAAKKDTREKKKAEFKETKNWVGQWWQNGNIRQKNVKKRIGGGGSWKKDKHNSVSLLRPPTPLVSGQSGRFANGRRRLIASGRGSSSRRRRHLLLVFLSTFAGRFALGLGRLFFGRSTARWTMAKVRQARWLNDCIPMDLTFIWPSWPTAQIFQVFFTQD